MKTNFIFTLTALIFCATAFAQHHSGGFIDVQSIYSCEETTPADAPKVM